MGEVFLARQESLDREVALKVLRSELYSDATRRLRFQREAEITAALDHPNIVPVYETGEASGFLYLSMKRLDGPTLDDVAGRLTTLEVARLGAALASALAAAHAVGVVHRDVKPANVMLVGDHPYLLDFGLARARVDLTLTQTGQAPGTLHYMAPEQLRGGVASLDPRVDIYALGATLFTAATGTPPFGERPAEVLVKKILMDDPRWPRGSRTVNDLSTILARAMAKEPIRRFDSAGALAEELERLAAGRPIASRPTRVIEHAWLLARRHHRVSVTIAVGLLVIGVVGGLLGMERHRAQVRLESRLERATLALAARRPARALEGARSVVDDFGAEPRAVALIRGAKKLLALETLMDEVVAESRSLDLPSLHRLADVIDAGRARADAASELEMARALIAAYGGDTEAVAEALGAPHWSHLPRTAAALRAWLQGSGPSPIASTFDVASPRAFRALDSVGVAAVRRFRQEDPAAILMELRADPSSSPRKQLALAMAHVMVCEDDAARWLLEGVVDNDRPAPMAQMVLAQIAAREGRAEAARRHLDEAQSDFARRGVRPSLRFVMTRIETELLAGATDRWELELSQAAERWPGHPSIEIVQAHRAAMSGDEARALAHLDLAMERASTPWELRRAQGKRLRILRNRQARGIAPEPGVDLRRDAEELLHSSLATHDDDVALLAATDCIALAVADGDFPSALEAARLGYGVGKEDRTLDLRWSAAGYEAVYVDGELSEDRITVARDVLERLQALLDDRNAGLTNVERATFATRGSWIALQLGRRATGRRLGALARVAADSAPTMEFDDLLGYLRTALEVDDWAAWID